MKTKKNYFGNNVNKVLLLILLIIGFQSVSNAQDCVTTEREGNRYAPLIIAQINAYAAGESYTISRRKKLYINRINSISFEGCRVTIVANVTLKRRIRRDATGNATITATVSSYSLSNFCLQNPKLDKLKLSNTLRIGEGFYKWIANKVVPNNHCYDLPSGS